MRRHTKAEVLRQGAYVEWIKAYEAESQLKELRSALGGLVKRVKYMQAERGTADCCLAVDKARAALKATEEG